MITHPARSAAQRRIRNDILKAAPNETIMAISSMCLNALENPNLRMTSALRRKVGQQAPQLKRLIDEKTSLARKRRLLEQENNMEQQSGGALPILPLLFSLLPTVGSLVGGLIKKV